MGALDAMEHFFEALNEKDGKGICSKKFITKVDIKGAFDNILPSDIIKTLTEKKFPRNLINIIDISSRLNILETGEMAFIKKNCRGIVQGPIFSPILFNILLATVLTPFTKVVKMAAAVTVAGSLFLFY